VVIVGIDVGGSLTKAVMLEKDSILNTSSVSTIEEPIVSASGILAKVMNDSGRSLNDIDRIGV
jgi:activator of 2-hydroxyglutaryl-CoA dehydratase